MAEELQAECKKLYTFFSECLPKKACCMFAGLCLVSWRLENVRYIVVTNQNTFQYSDKQRCFKYIYPLNTGVNLLCFRYYYRAAQKSIFETFDKSLCS